MIFCISCQGIPATAEVAVPIGNISSAQASGQDTMESTAVGPHFSLEYQILHLQICFHRSLFFSCYHVFLALLKHIKFWLNEFIYNRGLQVSVQVLGMDLWISLDIINRYTIEASYFLYLNCIFALKYDLFYLYLLIHSYTQLMQDNIVNHFLYIHILYMYDFASFWQHPSSINRTCQMFGTEM